MGAVYLARDEALERLVAVKVLLPEESETEEMRERFRREARTAAKLTHPAIIPLYTFGAAEGMMYFVMGYVQGESLAERLRRVGKLGADEVRRIVSDVAGALDYAHKQGVVHRDVKPDNVLLDDESGRAMLADFGIAKASASGQTLTELGAIVGTPYYMSPEQASGERTIDGRSDIYSLGVMAYHLLAGRLPFEGATFGDVIAQHVTRDPTDIKAIQPSVPDDLARAVMRCLAKEPQHRWPDGHVLTQALGQVDEDDEDRNDLRGNLDGIVPKMLLPIVAVAGLYWYLAYLFPGLRVVEDGPWWILPVLLVATPIVLPMVFAAIGRYRGISWRELQDLMLRSPKRWPFWWYPKRWRRDGDVWDRLPIVIKRLRLLFGGMAAVAGPTILFMTIALVRSNFTLFLRFPWIEPVFYSDMGIFYAIFFGSAVFLNRWARKNGLDHKQIVKIAFAPTGDVALWRKPRYAAVLLPPAEQIAQAGETEPRTPEEFLRAVGNTAKDFAGPTREVGSEAVSAAGQLVSAIQALDGEITKLGKDVEALETEAIEKKLAALGAESPDDGEARREMRGLLRSQLNLAHRLEAQLKAAHEQRARLTEMLKTLWLSVADLRARQARDTVHDAEITGRIRKICEDVQAHAEASETVNILTE